MKRILAALLLLTSAWSSTPEKPMAENATFNAAYYIAHGYTPMFVRLANPSNSFEVGISHHTQVWTSEKINDSTYALTGIREYITRVADSAIEKGFDGKLDTIRFDKTISTYKYQFWTDHIIGSGSGGITLSSQGTYATSGDRALIVAGTYTSGLNVSNVKGITMIPQTTGHTVFFTTAESSLRNVDSMYWGSFTFYAISGSAIDMRAYTGGGTNGPIRHTTLQDLFFQDVTSACIDANGSFNYTYRDSTTAAWLDVTLDSIREDRCNNLVQGSFGSPVDNTGHPPNVFLRPVITNLYSTGTTATTNQGVEIRCISFQYVFKYWVIIDTSGRGNSGDCGSNYGHGSGVEAFIYKWGGPGYTIRCAPTREIGMPGVSWEYNIFKGFSTDYGVIQHQDPDSVAGGCGAVDEIWDTHITGIRMPTDNTYWCQDVVNGNLACSGGVVNLIDHVKNDLAIEVADAASGGAGHDGGTGTVRVVIYMSAIPSGKMDTSNNQYFSTLAAAHLDTTHVFISNSYGTFYDYRPKSTSSGNIVNGGTADGVTTGDFNGVAWASPIPIGYLNVAGTAPPACIGCLPGFKYSIKHK